MWNYVKCDKILNIVFAIIISGYFAILKNQNLFIKKGKVMNAFKAKFLRVMTMFKFDLSEVAIIGDQLFTDILGGNRVGTKTILVNPMSKDDALSTKVFRFLENSKYCNLKKRGILVKGKYYE